MSTSISKVLAIGIRVGVAMDVKDAKRNAATFAREIGFAKAATQDLTDQLKVFREVSKDQNLTAEQSRIAEDRLTAAHERRTAKIAAETAALRELRAAQSATAAGQATPEQRSERRATVDAGRGYMARFDSPTQSAMREMREAYGYYRQGSIGADQYRLAVAAIRREHNPLHQSFDQLKGSLIGMAAPVAILYAGFAGLKRSIMLSAELDATTARFKVFTGSAEEASRTIAALRSMASKGIGFTSGAQSVSTMLQFGIETKNVLRDFASIAEITGGQADPMNRLALAFAQTQAAGRLMGQDLLQMVNAGFNPLKIISDQTGVSLVELKNRMADGAISAEQVRQAFHDAVAPGGRFNGLLEEISQTTAGKLTRAKSVIDEFAVSIGDMLRPATDGALDGFIDDLSRMARTAEMLSGTKSGGLSSLASMITFNPQTELAKAPSYVSDIAAAKATVDPGTSRLSSVMKQKAEATLRLDNSRLGYLISDSDREAAEKYLADLKRIESVLEDIKSGKKSNASPSELAAAKELDAVRQMEAANRHIDDATFNRMRQQADADIKRAMSQEDAQKAELAFIEKIKNSDPSRLDKEELQWAEKTRAALDEKTRAMKQADEVQKAFADTRKKAERDSLDATYGDKANIVDLLRQQSVDAERTKLDTLIKAKATYDDIVAAANSEAQSQAKSLELIQSQTKAGKDKEKQSKELEARAKEGLDEYKRDLESMQKAATDIRNNVDPQSGLIDKLSTATLLRDRGMLTDKELTTEQQRLAGDAVKSVNATAAPTFSRNSQESFQYGSGQMVDKVNQQIQLAERQAVLAATAIAVATKTNEKLDELIEGQPDVLGP